MSKESASTDLIIKLPSVPDVATFTDPDEFERLYSKITEAVKDHKPDVSTKTGRDAIASLAYKVARTKTALDGQGKALTDEWRKNTAKVNDTRNAIKDRLDALQKSVRQPLTDWEAAEEARIEKHQSALDRLIGFSRTGFGLPSAELKAMLDEVTATPAGETWQEFAQRAAVAKEDAIDTLTRLLATAEKQEADARELERLRADAAERDRLEAERLAAEEAARIAAARAERERQAEEQRKAELAKAAEEAAQRVERENAERVAAAERQAKEAQERAEREISEAKAKADRDAAAERQRLAAAQEAEAAEQRRRDADREHRKAVNNAIVAELVECANITAEQGQLIVVHLASGLVPNVTLKY